MIACGNDPDSGFFRERMVELLSFYYRNLLDAMSQTKAGTRHSVLKMHALRGDLEAVIKTVYQQLGLTVCPAFESALKCEAEHSSRFRSKHSYSARQFGYDEKTIVQRFAHVYEHPDFQDFDLARDSGQAPAGQRLVGEAS
jgi:hypothetical protein